VTTNGVYSVTEGEGGGARLEMGWTHMPRGDGQNTGNTNTTKCISALAYKAIKILHHLVYWCHILGPIFKNV